MRNNRPKNLPRILITMGEPAGIGPELLVRVAQLKFAAELVVIADPELLMVTAQKLNLPLELLNVDWQMPSQLHCSGKLKIEPIKLPEPVKAGCLNPNNATAILALLSQANELAVSGQVDALVTAPVHKANLNQVDQHFLGHTEFFAQQCNIGKVVMMLASGSLRISLATTHLPLSQVPQAITKSLLHQTLNVILESFSQLGLNEPKIAVCGLNPHAGEGGLLGAEDEEIISPVIKSLVANGKNIFGPFPADTLFTPEKRLNYDVFLAMYHDQGLPVVKAFGFGQCANVTLGLPYIRTSVDHGTALDIAASYSASVDSLEYATNYAIQLVSGKLP